MEETVACKRCPGCGETKPREAFGKHRSRKDGCGAYCKPCASRISAKHRAANPERSRRAVAKYRAANIDKARESGRATTARQRASTHGNLKHNAREAVRYAIKRGLLERPERCSQCDAACFPDAHHDSYARDKRLDVRFLCRICHANWHVGNKPHY